MKNIQYEVNSLRELPDCYIYEKGKYIIRYCSNRNYEESLPVVEIRYEKILKELGISYEMSMNYKGYKEYQYWDASSYEGEEYTLPVYVKIVGGRYRYIESKKAKKPTMQTIQRARRLERRVSEVIEEFEIREREKEDFLCFKEALRGKQAVGTYSLKCKEEKDFLFDGDHIKVVPVYCLKDKVKEKTENIAIFNVNAIELNSIVTIEVPKGLVGKFIGKNHWQVKEWCNKFGLKEINVVGF